MKDYLYILQIFGAGNPRIHNVLQYYGSAEKAAAKIMGGDKDMLSPKRAEAAATASYERSERIIEYCEKNGIKIVTYNDDDYPETLRNIFNPPSVLFVRGDLTCLEHRVAVAAVGPRMPDRYAAKLASVICPGLAECGIVLVSGLARGIDQTAHVSAVRAKCPTVAVLACGIDVEYPANTARLRQDIESGGGAVISELLPGTSCRAGYFEYRNRIISGLANGTLVIGGNNSSGSMITARQAAEQDRDLFFTVPADTLSPTVSHVIRYLRDGAIPVYDHYDIISEYYDIYGDRLNTEKIDQNRLGYLVGGGKVNGKRRRPVEPQPAEQPAAEDIPAEQPAERTVGEKLPAERPAVQEKPQGRAYVDMMPKKYRILLGYEKPDENENDSETTDITEKETAARDGSESVGGLRETLLGLISSSENGISLDEILRRLNGDFGEVTELLADMEMDGEITCKAGNVYTVN